VRSQQIYKGLFKTQISRELTDLWVTFPEAKHVTAIGCKFIAVKGTQHTVFMNSSDAGSCYGSPSFHKMFPNDTSITMKGCTLDEFEGNHVMIFDSLISGNARLSATDILHTTHVTVEGLVFVGVSGTQYSTFLSESTMIACSREDSSYFQGYNITFDDFDPSSPSPITIYTPGSRVFHHSNPPFSNKLVYDHSYFSILTASS